MRLKNLGVWGVLLFFALTSVASQLFIVYGLPIAIYLGIHFPQFSRILQILPEYCYPQSTQTLALICALLSALIFAFICRRPFSAFLDRLVPITEFPRCVPRLPPKTAWLCASLSTLVGFGLLFLLMVRTASEARLPGETIIHWLFIHTSGDRTWPWAGLVWCLVILCGLLAAVCLDGSCKSYPRLRGRRWEWIYVMGMTLLMMVYYAWDLNHWRYAIIGDEYAFYFLTEVLDRVSHNPIFSEKGVYGTHPLLSSLYQLFFLRLFDFSAFGWRFSSVFAACVGLPGIYLIARLLVGYRAAVWSTLLYAFSHYNFLFAHIPYNNNHVVFPVFTSLGVAIWAWRERSLSLAYLSGGLAGLGCYTFFSARVAIVILALMGMTLFFPLTKGRICKGLALGVFLSLGFLFTALPILRNPATSWKLMITQTSFAERLVGETSNPNFLSEYLGIQLNQESISRFKKNSLLTWISPLAFQAERASGRHFVRGGLVDRVTSALAILGLGQIFWFFRKERWRWLAIPYGCILAVVGMLCAGDYPYITRMLPVVPCLCLAASVALEKLHYLLSDLTGTKSATSITWFLVFLACALNVFQVKYRFPLQPVPSGHSLILSLAQESPPQVPVYYVLADEFRDDTVFKAITKLYGLNDRLLLVRFPKDGIITPLNKPCLVTFYEANPSWRDIQARLVEIHPDAKVFRIEQSLESALIVVEVGETGWKPTFPVSTSPSIGFSP